MADYYFDDFHVGDKFETGGATVTDAQILQFALQYDPQPMHLDKEAAAKNEFGGLIASGFHTLSLTFSLFFRLSLVPNTNLGSPGMEDVRWLKPMRPGDTIHSIVEVLELKPSNSKTDRGIVRMRHDAFNQKGELILSVNCLHRLKRKPG